MEIRILFPFVRLQCLSPPLLSKLLSNSYLLRKQISLACHPNEQSHLSMTRLSLRSDKPAVHTNIKARHYTQGTLRMLSQAPTRHGYFTDIAIINGFHAA